MSVLQFPTGGKSPSGPEGLAPDREADHRIANNLGLIIGLLRMRARAVAQHPGNIAPDEVGALLEDIAARVETVARLHRMLSQSYPNALVDVVMYLRELCGSLTDAVSPGARLNVSCDVSGTFTLGPDQVLTVGMLATELITNSVKYAHPTGLPVRIEIACGRTDSGSLLIEFADDGVGLPENFDPESDGGLGLRVAHALASQLHATLAFDSDELGTRARLEIAPRAELSA
jgi:two-component sensor histidine kinase